MSLNHDKLEFNQPLVTRCGATLTHDGQSLTIPFNNSLEKMLEFLEVDTLRGVTSAGTTFEIECEQVPSVPNLTSNSLKR